MHMCGHDYLHLHMCADHDAINCSTFAGIWEIIMQNLKSSGIDWHERILINKLYMDQSVNPFQSRDAIWHHAFHLFLIRMPFAHWLQ